MKKEPFLPGHYYIIRNSGNNFENLFLEERNYAYFLRLFERHIGQIATLHSFRFFRNSFELLLKFHDDNQIPEKYQDRLHLPFSNFFNAYCKSINKMYDRSGSLFREHFKRERVDDKQVSRYKNKMEESPVTAKNFRLQEKAIPEKNRIETAKRVSASRFPIAAIIMFLMSVTRLSAQQKISDAPLSVKNSVTDTAVVLFDTFNDDEPGNHFAIGEIFELGKIHAVYASVPDSSIVFYELKWRGWQRIGREKCADFNLITLRDLDADGKNELISETGTNMNGNIGYCFYKMSDSGNVALVGEFFGRYSIGGNHTVQYIYEGSWYMDSNYVLYNWTDDRLIPVRSATLSRKKTDAVQSPRWLIYEENRSGQLVQIFKETFRDRKKQRYLLDHIFDENFHYE